METEIKVSKDFSRFPVGRYKKDGPDSGERFREDLLLPAVKDALDKDGKVRVVLDGVVGLPSSFLEESFGGLVRDLRDVPLSRLRAVLQIVSLDGSLDRFIKLIEKYMNEAVGHRQEA